MEEGREGKVDVVDCELGSECSPSQELVSLEECDHLMLTRMSFERLNCRI